MTLVVEDGTGKADAESYVSVADAVTTATALGLTFANDANAEAALRRATIWMDATYRSRLGGWRTRYRDQALEFPRTGMWDNGTIPQLIAADEIPVEWKRACVIAAVREKASSGSLSPDVTPGQIKKSVEVSGAVKVEYAVGAGSVEGQRPIVTMIDDALSSLLPISRGTVLAGSVTR